MLQKGVPRAPTAGRRKGTPNKITKAFRHAVINVFNRLGGEDHLWRWAKRNPTEFYKIAARLIPTEIVGHDGGAIKIIHVLKKSPLDDSISDIIDVPEQSQAELNRDIAEDKIDIH